jgi:hypothetical protein
MRNGALIIVLLIVVAISYGLGRRHGGTRQVSVSPAPAHAENTEVAPKSRVVNKAGHAAGGSGFNALDRHAPFAQNLTSAERGYEAARISLDDALSQIESLPVAERMGFTTGIFSFVARNHTPADAMKVYQRVPEAFRANALRALVGEWIYTRSSLPEDQRHIKREGAFAISGSRFGLEIELTSMLASSSPDPELASAWLNAFSNHSNRSEMLLTLSRRLGSTSEPDAILARMEGWTPWEKERVTHHVIASWSYQSPQEAWQWYQANRGRFDQDLSSSILGPWASSDPEAVKGLLNTIQEPAQRRAAIEAIGKVLAGKNTDAAVAWANGLGDAGERQEANRVIYESAPRGIGAVLRFEKAFPTVTGIVPGSPLDGSGVQPGDQLLEVWEPGGPKHTLYAKDLSTTVNLLRGESGSQLTLRLLRQNKTSGRLEEYLVPVTRGQLYLNEKTLPNRFTPAGDP